MYLNERGILNYNLELKKAARDNRKNPTEDENKIWTEVLNNKRTGFKFSRQKPIDNFILDFYCSKLLLGIEIDGDIHNERQQKIYDGVRTDKLDILGIKVLRYSNNKVINDIDFVFKDIIKQIKIREEKLFK